MKKRVKALSYFLAVLLFITTILTAILVLTYTEIQRIPNMSDRIVDAEYESKMYDSISLKLQSKLGLTILEFEDIEDTIDIEELHEESLDAVEYLLTSLVVGASEKYNYENKDLEERIRDRIKDYAAKNKLEYEDSAAQKVYETLRVEVKKELLVLPDSYITHINPIVTKVNRVAALWYILLIVSLLIAVVLIVLNKDRIVNGMLFISTAEYFAWLVMYVFIHMMIDRDYLAQTVFESGTLAYLMRDIYRMVLSDIKTPILAFAIGSAIIVFIVLIINSIRVAKSRKVSEQ